MSSEREMIREKTAQAVEILKERGIDLWITFVREADTIKDPCLELILGTGCVWQSAFLVHRSGEKVAIVGSLDAANIKEHGHYPEVIGYRDSIREDLLKVLDRFKPGKIAVNFSRDDIMADGLTHGMYLNLMEYLKDSPFAGKIVSSEGIIAALRGRKSPSELHRLRASAKLALDIVSRMEGFLRPGLTERDVAVFLKEEVRKEGVELAWDPAMCPSVFSGPESAGAHAGPTDRKIEPGHLMNIDFGIRLNGYCSDIQRTWYFLRPGEGEPPEIVSRAFLAVRDAIRMAVEAIRPGVEGRVIDAISRNHIISKGFEEYPHALGHQIGRKAHDGAGLLCPCWERYGTLPYQKIEKGQVYTVEPRANVPGHGIATIEEEIVVTQSGAEFLSQPQKDLYLVRP